MARIPVAWDPRPDQLHIVLPTFAADYSGVCSVLYELGGLAAVYDPGSCTSNFISYDEPRACEGYHARTFTSGLDDMQALMGDDKTYVDAVCQAYEAVGGSFVAVIGTPNTMILGTDYAAIARELGRRLGVPALSFATTGTAFYDVGASQALLAVGRQLVAPQTADGTAPARPAPQPRTVNLLGATPLDLLSQRTIDEARRLLEEGGWHVLSCWAMGSTLDDMRAGLAAQVNVVLTTSGLAVARWMRDTFGIPYVWAALSGERAVEEFLRHLDDVASGRADGGDPLPHGTGTAGATPTRGGALVIADRVMAEGMRRALELDEGYDEVDVATFFSCEPATLRASDTGGLDEARATQLIRDAGYGLVVGDALLAGFAAPDGTTKLAALPHEAISSRLSWADTTCPYGRGFLDAIAEARVPDASAPWVDPRALEDRGAGLGGEKGDHHAR